MANPEHLAKLKEGVKAWNKWKQEDPSFRWGLREADLCGVDLRGEILKDVNFSRTLLRQANLNGADLRGSGLFSADLGEAQITGANLGEASLHSADLSRANLQGTNLVSVDLEGADLVDANLDQANLSWATLRATNFSNANLHRANLMSSDLRDSTLTDADVGSTVLGDNDLSTVKGLETVHHVGPSTIGIDTIFRSKGNIPESFLRGAGVPEGFIAYMKSMIAAAAAIEFYSCFISYSTKDQEFADRLYSDLQAKGVRCWFAPHDAQGGRKLHEQIDTAIRLHDKLLLILSPHSMESEWVKTEIAKARKREVRDNRRVLFPIRLATFETLRDWESFDADTGKDSAREIREYFIPDFSNWKMHDLYQEAFSRLINDLKA
jgi:uncharacterized protein YjbI with pentapeptide repeats